MKSFVICISSKSSDSEWCKLIMRNGMMKIMILTMVSISIILSHWDLSGPSLSQCWFNLCNGGNKIVNIFKYNDCNGCAIQNDLDQKVKSFAICSSSQEFRFWVMLLIMRSDIVIEPILTIMTYSSHNITRFAKYVSWSDRRA